MCPLETSLAIRISFHNTTARGGKEWCDCQKLKMDLKMIVSTSYEFGYTKRKMRLSKTQDGPLKVTRPSTNSCRRRAGLTIMTTVSKYSVKFWVTLVILMSLSQFLRTVLTVVLFITVLVKTLAASYCTSYSFNSCTFYRSIIYTHTPKENRSTFCLISWCMPISFELNAFWHV